MFEGVVWLISLGDLNEIIAKDCESLDYEKLVSYIDVLICASSDWKIIKERFLLSDLEAQTLSFLVQKHQISEDNNPVLPSLITMIRSNVVNGTA